MGKKYNSYISRKLFDTRTEAVVTSWAVWGADHCADSPKFALLDFASHEVEVYRCIVDRNMPPGRVSIDKLGGFNPIDLSDIYTPEVVSRYEGEWNKLFIIGDDGSIEYDDYNDLYLEPEELNKHTEKQIESIDTLDCDTVVVTGEYIRLRPVLYALQQKFRHVVVLDTDAAAVVNTKKRISTPAALETIRFNLNRKDYSARSVLNPEFEPIYVPLDEATLQSSFCGDIKWGDLLANTEPDASIGDVAVKILSFGLVMDIFGNVILNVFTTGKPTVRIVPLRLPFGGKSIAEETGTRKEQRVQPPKPKIRNSKEISPETTVARKSSNVKTMPKSEPVPVEEVSASSSTVDADFTATFAFGGVMFPVAQLLADIDKLSLKDLYGWRKKIDKVLDTLFASEVFICDTNFWVQEKPGKKGEMYYIWLLDNFIKKFTRLPHRPYFEITNDVYDEIIKHAANNVAAGFAAKKFISDVLVGMNLVVTPDIRSERDRHAYADSSLMKRIQELYLQGKKVSVLTNDTEAIYRWTSSIADQQANGLTKPAFIRNVNLERLYRLRFEIKKQIDKHSKKNA